MSSTAEDNNVPIILSPNIPGHTIYNANNHLHGNLCDEVETVSEFTYFGDSVSDLGGCEVAVTARTR